MKKFNFIKKILLIMQVFLLTAAVMAQDITNTLGSGGIFTIKDASTNFFTLNGSTGQVNILRTFTLESTINSSTGVIYQGGDPLLHTYGNSNLFFGESAGNFTLSGLSNVGVGEGALFSLTSGSRNSANGFSPLSRNTTGSDNSAFGFGSLSNNTTGSYNSAFGSLSLLKNTTGSFNAAFGYSSLVLNLTGNENTALGRLALSTNTGGSWNSAFGSDALSKSTMNFNTGVGFSSGTDITTGSGLTCIGFNSQPSSGNAVNQITLGNNQITSLRCAVTTITSLSDARDKRNIKDLGLGIGFLMKIKPRLFNWDKREWYEDNISDGSKMHEAPTAGFIAQELDDAQTSGDAQWLNLILKDNREKLEAQAGNLLPVIVKAMQELKLENDNLKERNAGLKSKNKKYKKLLNSLKQLQEALKGEVEKMKSINTEFITGDN